ncbi:MAG: hypothetical protein LUG95_08800 [Clostridiales bacterium]|nr:hypothetical protein [Clostridiales bacterium]
MAQVIFIVAVLTLWQILYSSGVWPEILFPSVKSIGKAFIKAFVEDGLGSMVLHSLGLIVKGLVIGILAALVFSSLSVISETFYAIYNMIVSMFDIIPGIALIPVAILWLGIGDNVIIFMVIHSVVWLLSRSIIDGFNAVPKLL